jgi:hypothetical protein
VPCLLLLLLLLLLLQGNVWGSGAAAVCCAALAILTGNHAIWQVSSALTLCYTMLF